MTYSHLRASNIAPKQAATRERHGLRNPDDIQDRRSYVEKLYLTLGYGPSAGRAWKLDDQRNPQQLVEKAVRVPSHESMLTKLFAVICRQHNQRRIEETVIVEALDQASECVVHGTNPGIVNVDDMLEISTVDLQRRRPQTINPFEMLLNTDSVR
jgi:hypothetical protein